MTSKRPLLKWGSKGPQVSELQRLLNQQVRGLTPKLKVDGVFGKLTYQAVLKFQKQAKIKEDGVVGPQTWGKIDKTGSPGDGAKDDKSQYPGVPNASLPLQRTPHDCGFFAGYFLAKANERGSVQGLSFTEQDVLDAKKRFLSANGLPDVYLGPHNVPDFLKSVGLTGFKNQPFPGVFKTGSDNRQAVRYVYQRLGTTGFMVGVQTFASGSSGVQGHWFSVVASQAVKNDLLFLVYDSSGMIPNNRRRDGMPAGTCLCWVRAWWLVAHLKTWLPAAFTSRH